MCTQRCECCDGRGMHLEGAVSRLYLFSMNSASVCFSTKNRPAVLKSNSIQYSLFTDQNTLKE